MSTWSLVIKNVIDIDREKRTSMYYTYEVKNGIGKKNMQKNERTGTGLFIKTLRQHNSS